jgi:hypothetical protein
MVLVCGYCPVENQYSMDTASLDSFKSEEKTFSKQLIEIKYGT